MTDPTTRPKTTVARLREMKRNGDKFPALTAYDASFATLVDAAGVDVVLVGDSLGNVVQGHDSTVPVTMDDMVYHTRLVARGCRHALLMADLPFMSFTSETQALANAARLVQEGGARMVKIEGTGAHAAIVRRLSDEGVPVCAHLGLRPQIATKLGGYRVQGRDEAVAAALRDDARRLEDSGADLLLLECVTSTLARAITEASTAPVIGIGAGPDVDGQILVLYDVLGITPGRRPRFSRDFLSGAGSVSAALEAFAAAVRSREFPAPEHCFD